MKPQTDDMCPYCGRPEGGVHGDHRVRRAPIPGLGDQAPQTDPRIGHGESGLFRHEPGAPCVVCDRTDQTPRTEEELWEAFRQELISDCGHFIDNAAFLRNRRAIEAQARAEVANEQHALGYREGHRKGRAERLDVEAVIRKLQAAPYYWNETITHDLRAILAGETE